MWRHHMTWDICYCCLATGAIYAPLYPTARSQRPAEDTVLVKICPTAHQTWHSTLHFLRHLAIQPQMCADQRNSYQKKRGTEKHTEITSEISLQMSLIHWSQLISVTVLMYGPLTGSWWEFLPRTVDQLVVSLSNPRLETDCLGKHFADRSQQKGECDNLHLLLIPSLKRLWQDTATGCEHSCSCSAPLAG